MKDISLTKKEIRKQIKEKRNNLTDDQRTNKGTMIAKKIEALDAYRSCKSVFLYADANGELPTEEIFKLAKRDGKKVAYPKVENGEMNFYYVSDICELKPGYFGICEPESVNLASTDDAIIIVPGVAFSKEGDRIGYGGGFYDRFLGTNSALSIGICYDFQLYDKLETESFDKKTDMVISV